jgi:predicted nucleic acid-binding protein
VLLVDSSVWIEVLRPRAPLALEEIVPPREVVTCLPIMQEVLSGIREERLFSQARDGLLALPIVEDPMGRHVFEEATALYRLARRTGLTIRSSVDCLIAACALRNDLTILHRDRDFRSLAKISGLKQRET